MTISHARFRPARTVYSSISLSRISPPSTFSVPKPQSMRSATPGMKVKTAMTTNGAMIGTSSRYFRHAIAHRSSPTTAQVTYPARPAVRAWAYSITTAATSMSARPSRRETSGRAATIIQPPAASIIDRFTRW